MGFAALLSADGELLTFRGGNLVGLVDRGLGSEPRDVGEVKLSADNQARIEFMKSALAGLSDTSAPRKGETITDADGAHHRIQSMRTTDITYRCDCETS